MRRAKALDLREWAKGKPLFLSLFAVMAAAGAEGCYEACSMARRRERPDGKDTALPVEQWEAFYADEAAMMKKVLRELFRDTEDAECMELLAGMEEEFKQFMKKDDGERKAEIDQELKRLGVTDFKSLVELGKKINEEAGEMVREAATGTPEPRPADWRERVGAPEVLFFFGVWFPCWIEYGVKLSVLVEKAKGGNLKALEDLLRLDKAALELPEVRRQYEGFSGNKGVFRRLNKALAGRPLRRLTRRKIKVTLAGLIYKVFRETDERLQKLNEEWKAKGWPIAFVRMKVTTAEIRRLFDAVAKLEHGTMADDDLGMSPHGFYLAVCDEVKFWPDLALPSEKS